MLECLFYESLIVPKKLTPQAAVPTLIQERLTTWGRCIRAQRLAQRITSPELAQRMNVSRATLQRLERGDPGAAAASYLRAFLVLGVLEEVAPGLPASLWAKSSARRVVHPRRFAGHDDDF